MDIHGAVDHVDALVIGGGPAGLSASIYLARARRSVALFDCVKTGRSDWGQVNFNYLGFPDGVSLIDLLTFGRLQAERFGVQFFDAEVASLTREHDGSFKATAPNVAMHGSGVLLATGVEDRWPAFPGYEEFVGKSMHWCIVCDGYEMQGKRVVVVGNDEGAAEMAVQMTIFTKDVTLLSNSGSLGLPASTVQDLEGNGIRVVVGRLARAKAKAPGEFSAIELVDGREIPLDHLFSMQGAEPNNALARSLGVDLDALGYIKADTEGRTNVPGVFAAGDVTRLFSHQVTTAVHEGAAAALALNYYLFKGGHEG